MRPAEFTPEEIIAAGQQLQAAGRNVTGFALRQRVGGGNAQRLKQVWDEFVSSQAAVRAEPVAELPTEVAEEMAAVAKALGEQLHRLAVDLNDRAVKAAERRVAEVIRTAGEQREQAERELVDASLAVEEMERHLDESRASTGMLTAHLQEARATNQAQAIEMAQLKEKLAQAEHQICVAHEERAAEQRRHAEEMAAERARHAHQFEQLSKDLAEQRARTTAAERLHEECRQASEAQETRHRDRLAQAKAARDEALEAANSANIGIARRDGQIETLQTQIDSLMQAIGKAGSTGNESAP